MQKSNLIKLAELSSFHITLDVHVAYLEVFNRSWGEKRIFRRSIIDLKKIQDGGHSSLGKRKQTLDSLLIFALTIFSGIVTMTYHIPRERND